MKKLLITLVALFGFMTNANSELSQSELNKLTSQQRQIYLNQLNELNAQLKQLEWDLFKAEDMIKMGQEMKSDNGKFSGSYYVMKGMNLKEKAEKEINKTKSFLQALDKSAREAIRKSEMDKRE
ncbi:MAG: hypothetical protein IJS63_06400 [Bacteroidaceae bacterium]|nr:hypothetical protein [Bacteroidaceae bacterium]